MEDDIPKIEQPQKLTQRISALVRARLLFQREVSIDRGGDSKFDEANFQRLIQVKSQVDAEMSKMLVSAAALTLLLYLVGAGINPELPVWGIQISGVPGILLFLAVASAFNVALATYAFFNSQTYAALIDQFVLKETREGVLDVDMLKASYEKEWLIFKVLRRDFSFYAPVHIQVGWLGRTLNSITFVSMVLISTSPSYILVLAQPYLTLTLLPNDWGSVLAKGFSLACSLSVFLLITVTQFKFKSEQDLDQQT